MQVAISAPARCLGSLAAALTRPALEMIVIAQVGMSKWLLSNCHCLRLPLKERLEGRQGAQHRELLPGLCGISSWRRKARSVLACSLRLHICRAHRLQCCQCLRCLLLFHNSTHSVGGSCIALLSLKNLYLASAFLSSEFSLSLSLCRSWFGHLLSLSLLLHSVFSQACQQSDPQAFREEIPAKHRCC